MDDATSSQLFLDALNTRDPEHIQSILAPDFTFEDVAGPGTRSIEAFLHELSMLFEALPDLTFQSVRVATEGVCTFVEFRAFGRHQGAFLGVAPTGTLAIISGVFNLDMTEGRVRRLRMTVDFGGLRRQLLLAARR